MTIYSLPAEPAAEVLWTRGTEVLRWTRRVDPLGRVDWTRESGVGTGRLALSWAELLQVGEVLDVHPALAQWPTPWQRDTEGYIDDAQRNTVLDVGDADLANVIIGAVNAWAERVAQ